MHYHDSDQSSIDLNVNGKGNGCPTLLNDGVTGSPSIMQIETGLKRIFTLEAEWGLNLLQLRFHLFEHRHQFDSKTLLFVSIEFFFCIDEVATTTRGYRGRVIRSSVE